jgi:hypothetical protein
VCCFFIYCLAECRYAECHYVYCAECHYVEWHYVGCHYAECLGAVDGAIRVRLVLYVFKMEAPGSSTVVEPSTTDPEVKGSNSAAARHLGLKTEKNIDQGTLTEGKGSVPMNSLL